MKLTKAQERYLAEIEDAAKDGTDKAYNGRARRTVEALRDAHLIGYQYEQRAHAKGNGIEITERFVCYPAAIEAVDFGAIDRTRYTRYTIFTVEEDGYPSEEIDVDAINERAAQAKAEQLLERDYMPGLSISGIEQRFGLYL